jgi:hypothetical protein
MSRHELEELMQREIDGVNSAAETNRLRELLAGSPDLDARFGVLRRASEALGRVERLDPPPGFADDVMSTVRRRLPEPRPGWREALRALLAPVPLAACAAALVLGVVLGGLLPQDAGLFPGRERDALSGTVLPHGRLGSSANLDRQAVAGEGVRGEAVTRIEEGRLVVDLELDTTRPVDVSLELEGTGLSPRAFSRDGPPAGDVRISAGEVRFVLPTGRGRTSVAFDRVRPGGKSLRLRVGDEGDQKLSLEREVHE